MSRKQTFDRTDNRVKPRMLMGLKTIHHVIYLVFFLQSTLPSKVSTVRAVDTITEDDVRKKVDIALYYINASKLHETIIRDTSQLVPETPTYGFFITSMPDIEALEMGRKGLVSALATQLILSSDCHGRNHHTEECLRKAAAFSLKSTALFSVCEKNSPDCSQRLYTPYRSIDGACNHRSSQGKSFTAYNRLISSAYGDNIETPRRSRNRHMLPNARRLSNTLTEFKDIRHEGLTMAILQWGQFLEHDLSRPAVSAMYHYDEYFKCCEDNGFRMQPRYMHKACSTIPISHDPFYKTRIQHCMNYVRSLPAVDFNCRFGPRQQLNQATSFLDGSQIYGVSSANSDKLRNFTRGQLKTSTLHGKGYLPLSSDPTKDCLTTDKKIICFLSGDPRVNFEPQTIAMHTLWVREHNRIAKELNRINGGQMNDEQLFQETRRIVIAEMQAITYKEWAAEILDRKYLNLLENSYYFDENINPAIINSVAVSVFGAFKSLYPNRINLYSKDNTEDGILELKEHYYKPNIFKDISKFDSVLRSITSQTVGKFDMNFREDLINYLYSNGEMSFDVLALNVQRERDHGLPSYNTFRMYLGHKEAKEFSDFGDTMSKNDYMLLSNLYGHSQDVDLIVGGLLETPMKNSLMGPTFSWLLTNQLWRIKTGDRFFYSHRGHVNAFNGGQLFELNKVSFARIICDNSDHITAIQPNVFKVISESNPLVNCADESIPRMSLTAWKLA